MTYTLAQWEKQSSLALILPNQNTHWQEYLDEILDYYCKFSLLVASYQKVKIITKYDNIPKILTKNSNIEIIKASYNDTWARDILPISIRKNKKIVLLNFLFNGWGQKYEHTLDNALSKSIFDNLLDINICLEGGGIESNGDGIILLNKQSFAFNRNKQSFDYIVSRLESIFLAKILVVNSGYLKGDDTDSHIDTLARFVNKDTILYLSCDDRTNPNFMSLSSFEQDLKQIAKENNLNIIPVPAPSQKYYNEEYLPATYMNFVIINGAVIVPTYNDENDCQAIGIIKKYFTTRKVIGFDASVLVRQNGSIHCSCMNFFED